MNNPVKIVARAILRFIILGLFRTKVVGAIPQQIPARLIVAANHESFLDGLILGLTLPFDPVFVVHTSIANNFWFRIVLSLVDYVAVDPTSPMAMKTLARVIEKGRPVVIFPEGRITVTGSLMKIYEGPAFLAAKTGAQILPIRLEGPARSYFSRLRGSHPKEILPAITVHILPIKDLPMPDLPRAKERRRKAGEILRSIMQEALFASTPPKTLWNALIESVGIHGRRRTVVEDVSLREFTYGELMKMGVALSLWIESKIPGNASRARRVGILMPNVAPTLGLLFGLSSRSITPCMLNYTAGLDSVLSAVKSAEIKDIVASRAFVEKGKLGPLVAGLEASGARIHWVDNAKSEMTLLQKIKTLYFTRHPAQFALHEDPSSEAVVLFTSGSEGKPKGVSLSHKAIHSNAAQIRAVMDINVEDKFLCALPLFHSFGLTAGSVLPVLAGARLFLYPSPLHYRVIPEIAYDRNCTVLFGTNTFLAQYAKFANPYDFVKIRRVVAGAEKLQDATREIWNDKFGIRIFEGYGATELAPVIAVNTPMAFRRGSVGQILPGIEHRLVPVPGVDAGGTLHVRGPNLMSGYLKEDHPGVIQPPSSDTGEGWHDLGDIVEVDEDGFIFIRGRLKRFAKIAGEMVSLDVCEKVAAKASPSALHACVSRSDPQKGEALVLYTTDTLLARDALLAAAREIGISELAVPRDIRQIDSIPVLGTGKTDYVSLNKLAAL